jgi:hypothetical protein
MICIGFRFLPLPRSPAPLLCGLGHFQVGKIEPVVLAKTKYPLYGLSDSSEEMGRHSHPPRLGNVIKVTLKSEFFHVYHKIAETM